MSLISQTLMFARFAIGLRRYLRHKLTPVEAWRLSERRRERREQNLLNLARRAIFPYPHSPYARLFKHAGCEPGDLERMLRADGLDQTLGQLRDVGVYVSIEELKARCEVKRGSTRFAVAEQDFDNPRSGRHLEAASGASRSAGTRTVYDLDYLADKWAPHQLLRFDAYDALGPPIGMWLPIMPGAGPVSLLGYAKAGITPQRWFTPVDESDFAPALKNRLGTLYIVHAGRLFGTPLPVPEPVRFDQAVKIARWMADTVRAHGGCWLTTYVSAATRVARAAVDAGIDLSGARFSVSSEPFTAAKQQEIEACGAQVHSMYAYMEAGLVGLGCAGPEVPDDNHLLDDCVALIQRRRTAPGSALEVDAFLFTTLLSSSPKILLNAENGDFGVVERRACGCPLERRGFATHLHTIRGFDKLTGEGMSFVGTDLIRIVEEVLPARFGGSSLHYQLLEEEAERGQTRLSVLVSPELGQVDEEQVVKTALAALAEGADHNRMMARIWEDAGTLRVKRQRPITTARGKVLPLHIADRSRSTP